MTSKEPQDIVERAKSVYELTLKSCEIVRAITEATEERCRRDRIERGLPADPPPFDLDGLRAETAALRAEHDAIEAERIANA